MAIMDYFRPVATITPEEVRKMLRDKAPDGYNLVDVRQPLEYADGHLPGARLIPAGKLMERLGELDPSKPTVAY
jgi:rhodanese-related sulfurtransferase